MVTPAGESILIDAGLPIERDAGRIEQVARDVAGLSRIDHMVVTHWHRDHYGAIGLLDGRLAFGRFYDRGIPDEVPEDPEHFPPMIEAYRRAGGDSSVTLGPGDEISLAQTDGPGLRLRCLMSDGRVQSDAGGEPIFVELSNDRSPV